MRITVKLRLERGLESTVYKYKASSPTSTLQEVKPDDYNRPLQHYNFYVYASTSLSIVLEEIQQQ